MKTSALSESKIWHLLHRLSFGPIPGEVDRLQRQGIEAYLQAQLAPATLSESPQFRDQLQSLETLPANPPDKRAERPKVPQQLSHLSPQQRRQRERQQQRKLRRALDRQRLEQARKARLWRGIASTRQLQEMMVDFWFNHFNVYGERGTLRFWVGDYEQQAIRPHVFGSFRDLLAATARHPAMLIYLDNRLNTAPGSPGSRGKFKGLNENYARELMELHTLGVDGGYTQADVIALTRILTGWGLVRPSRQGGGDKFAFEADRHDWGDKIFLGTTIKGSGISEVEQVFELLTAHPSTARHVSYQLAQFFVADSPPTSLVNRLSQRFLETEGEIRLVLETLFTSPEFWEPTSYRSKFKTPYQYLISLIRAAGLSKPNLKMIIGMLGQLEMKPYGCPTPDGYKNTQQAWLNPDALLRRLSLATGIARGRLEKGRPVSPQQLLATLGPYLSPQTQNIVKESPPAVQAALILGSPEMMYR